MAANARSISPSSRTKVSPVPMTAITPLWARMFVMLSLLRKSEPAASEKTMNRTIRAPIGPSVRLLAATQSRRLVSDRFFFLASTRSASGLDPTAVTSLTMPSPSVAPRSR